MKPQNGVVLEHPAGELTPVLRLDFHMDEDKLRFPVLRFDPCNDIGLAHVAFRDVGEAATLKSLGRSGAARERLDNPELIREHARRLGVPADRISEIKMEVSPEMFR